MRPGVVILNADGRPAIASASRKAQLASATGTCPRCCGCDYWFKASACNTSNPCIVRTGEIYVCRTFRCANGFPPSVVTYGGGCYSVSTVTRYYDPTGVIPPGGEPLPANAVIPDPAALGCVGSCNECPDDGLYLPMIYCGCSNGPPLFLDCHCYAQQVSGGHSCPVWLTAFGCVTVSTRSNPIPASELPPNAIIFPCVQPNFGSCCECCGCPHSLLGSVIDMTADGTCHPVGTARPTLCCCGPNLRVNGTAVWTFNYAPPANCTETYTVQYSNVGCDNLGVVTVTDDANCPGGGTFHIVTTETQSHCHCTPIPDGLPAPFCLFPGNIVNSVRGWAGEASVNCNTWRGLWTASEPIVPNAFYSGSITVDFTLSPGGGAGCTNCRAFSTGRPPGFRAPDARTVVGFRGLQFPGGCGNCDTIALPTPAEVEAFG